MNIEEIKEILYKAYDIDEENGDADRGCYVNGSWLSIESVIETLKEEM